MAIVAGIDEAGYGPILGPLVVSRTMFEVPDHHADACLWTQLNKSITRQPRQRGRRLPIVDSKKLHSSQRGVAALEKTALTMLACHHGAPASVPELISMMCPRTFPVLQQYPWYRNMADTLPVANEAQSLALKANAVRCDLKEQGVRFAGAASCILAAGQYNRLVHSTRNKATVLWTLTLRLISDLITEARGQELHIFIDRQGTRLKYAQPLLTAFENVRLEIMCEEPQRCHYRLGLGDRPVHIQFIMKGEDHKLPIALASIYSKYLRELLMAALNRYWQTKIKSLKRTAGYYTDGLRFLQDIEPALKSLDIDRSLLVRSW